MNAMLINIGEELLIGQVVNTNSAFIGRELLKIGVSVRQTVVVEDDAAAIHKAIRDGLRDFDVVITTGGLGPTVDDMTRHEIARIFDQSLVLNERALNHIKERYAKRNMAMPQTNIQQAMVPQNAELIDNPHGTALGIFLQKSRRYFFALPGVPREMEWMIEHGVIPRLQPSVSGKVIRQKTLLTSGIPESRLAELLVPITGRKQPFKLAFLPSAIGVRLRLTAVAPTAEETESILNKGEVKIREILNDDVYGTDDDSMAAVVGQLLTESGYTLAVAESCTGGLIGHWLTEVPGSSNYVECAYVTYSNRAKVALVGVKPESLEQWGAVSEAVAAEMATGARTHAQTDFALSTTGIAGPGGATAEKPVGLVYIGLATADETRVEKHVFLGDRSEVKERAAQAALNILRKHLLSIT